MKSTVKLICLLLGVMLPLLPKQAQAQVITVGPDSMVVSTAEATVDTLQKKSFFWSSLTSLDQPSRAALRSAIIPGLGQAYNRSYWKIPIIYAGGAVIGYFLVINNTYYQSYKSALIARRGGSATDKYASHPSLGRDNPNGTLNLAFYKDGYRRNRDITIFISVAAWTLNIAEAYVDAHLKEFDVSKDVSLRLYPNLINVAATSGVATGLTLTLYTR